MSKPQMVYRTDWARVRMSIREHTDAAIPAYIRKHPTARTEGFLISQVEDWIEKEFGRKNFTAQVCFGRGDKAHQEVVFESGMLYDDLKRAQQKKDNGERLYYCVDEQHGRREHLFKPIGYMTPEDWDSQDRAHDERRINALKESKLARGRASYMRENDIRYYKDVPSSVRESFKVGIGLSV